MAAIYWQQCIEYLKDELPAEQFNTWIRPLRAEFHNETMVLCAPNRFILDWVKGRFLGRISELMIKIAAAQVEVRLEVNHSDYRRQPSKSPVQQNRLQEVRQNPLPTSKLSADPVQDPARQIKATVTADWFEIPDRSAAESGRDAVSAPRAHSSNRDARPVPTGAATETKGSPRHPASDGKLRFRGVLDPEKSFDSFIVGNSNQLAKVAALQVAEHPGEENNPLFIYGGVGLGKTHLMQAIGNSLKNRQKANVVYLHSETFVNSMVSAIRLNATNEFKQYYRSADALLIDDIQFFTKKERSQEELFHTLNNLLEGGQQIVLTSDRFHKEITHIEDRLVSRFGWGLTVAVEPPDLETRAAILMNKAALCQAKLPQESALFIAQRVRSNVRELEGALKRVVAHAEFTGRGIDTELIKDALRDLFAVQQKNVSIDNIKRTVAEYHKIKFGDMVSNRRNRSVARPRQIAMALSKELTNFSLPEIGDEFGGRDHTTVLHACRKVAELRKSDTLLNQDYNNLYRILSA